MRKNVAGLLILVTPLVIVGISVGQVGVPLGVLPHSLPSLAPAPAGARTSPDPIPAILAHDAQSSYRVTLVSVPSKCLLTLGVKLYSNGTTVSGLNPGFVTISAYTCWGEAFVSWTSTAGPVNASGANPAILDLESNGTLTASYATGYNVTFNETGLPASTTWTVTLDGNSQTSESVTPNFVEFQAIDGLHSYRIAKIPNYSTKYRGTVTVSGESVTIQVLFTYLIHTVSFEEKGLPAETWWEVTFNGTPELRTSATVSFGEPNGTYSYSVSTVVGYTANLTTGSVKISGSGDTIYIGFVQNATRSTGVPTSEKVIVVGGVAAVLIGSGLVYALAVRRKTPR